MVYFTADTHFFHRNIIKYSSRPFSSVEDMHENLITQWNGVVGKNDIIYHLGDFSLGSPERTAEVLERLNGVKYLCIGSHERSAMRAGPYFEAIEQAFLISVVAGGENRRLFMSHYCHKTWPFSRHGSWHLFGHSHGRLDEYAKKEGKLMDVGVDSNFYTPVSLDQVACVMETCPPNFNDRG